ncbi:excalibur calcium-binding domain-containing protein [Streptomyces sp. NBC_01443]|uniref:excalibur calcium-binding domain-containing protein n=1 Tax=Streptomyces sp. NBC_01443 TaxID=2903868 RepID=UPI0022595C17|nr:excalibur calcium-binding domain-containing protein [Streptomyces sp. NBC_01443]MCX4632739.1 excalibur calcium-binding domain-containing protein [Streptomyces sp. NBC_01443]
MVTPTPPPTQAPTPPSTPTPSPTVAPAAPAEPAPAPQADRAGEATHDRPRSPSRDAASTTGGSASGTSSSSNGASSTSPGSSAFYKNCSAARAAGAAPVHRGDPGYGPHLDRDGDGVACE